MRCGILAVMLRNDAVCYSAADDGALPSIDFAKPVIELAKISGLCSRH